MVLESAITFFPAAKREKRNLHFLTSDGSDVQLHVHSKMHNKKLGFKSLFGKSILARNYSLVSDIFRTNL